MYIDKGRVDKGVDYVNLKDAGYSVEQAADLIEKKSGIRYA